MNEVSNRQRLAQLTDKSFEAGANCKKARRQHGKNRYIKNVTLASESVKFNKAYSTMKVANLSSSSSSSATSSSEEETRTIKASSSADSTQKEGEEGSDAAESPIKGEKEKSEVASGMALPKAITENREQQLRIRKKGCLIGEIVPSRVTGKNPRGSRNAPPPLPESSDEEDWFKAHTRPFSVKTVSYTHLTLPTTPYV